MNSSENNEKIQQILENLAEVIFQIVSILKVQTPFLPTEEPFYRQKVVDFVYTNKGIEKISFEGDHVNKPSWRNLHLGINRDIKDTQIYKESLKQLNSNFKSKIPTTQILKSFINTIIGNFVNQDYYDPEYVNKIITSLLKELEGKPINWKATADIIGIAVQSKQIELPNEIYLRRPSKENFEKETWVYSYEPSHRSYPFFGAFLITNSISKTIDESIIKIIKTVTILRLYKPASVNYIHYEIIPEKIITHGKSESGIPFTGSSNEIYFIKQEDEASLKEFFIQLWPILPDAFLQVEKLKVLEPSVIAYQRYSDSLLQNGIYERRVANAIMGLESLFLTGNTEATLRLSIRVAKLLSALNKDPIQVRENIKRAYDIRSLFLHGGHLNEKNKHSAKYGGDPDLLLHSITEYLRLSIIVYIITGLKKTELIDLLDRALLISEDNNKLCALLNPILKFR